MSPGTEQGGLTVAPPVSPAVRSSLGKVVVMDNGAAAQFVFETSIGRARYASDGAGERARELLECGGSVPFSPPVQYAAAAAAVVFSPFAALAGSIEAKGARMSDADLRQAEVDLVAAAKAETDSSRMLQALQRAAKNQLHRNLPVVTHVTAGGKAELSMRVLAQSGYDTGLELRSERLRLEKTGKRDTSYALLVEARARLYRLSDGRLLYDEPVSFQSGPGLFLDWTLGQGAMLRTATESAYDCMSEAVVEQVFLQKSVQTVSASGRPSGKGASPVTKTTTVKTKAPSGRGVLEVTAPPLTPDMLANLGTVGLISTSTIPTRLQLQRPLTVNQGVEEVSREAAGFWTDDEDLPTVFRYPVLDAVSAAAVIPLGIGGQIVGGVQGVPEKKLSRADQALGHVVNSVNLQDMLRGAVANQINSLAPQPVRVVPKLLPPGREAECSQMSCYMAGTLSWLPDHQTPEYYLRSQGIDTVVEVYLMHPALQGNGNVNPRLSVTMDARATLLRVQNSEPLYAVDIRYRGPEQRFIAWAKDDGQPLREELDHCVQTVAAAIVEHLAVPAWRTGQAPAELAKH